MNTLYNVIALTDHSSEMYSSRAQFLQESDAVTYLNLLGSELKSARNKILYKGVWKMLHVELAIGHEDTTAPFAISIYDGLPFLQDDFNGIQEYLDEVIYEFIDDQLSDKEPLDDEESLDDEEPLEETPDASLPGEFPVPVIIQGSTPTA